MDDIFEIPNVIGKTYADHLHDRLVSKNFPWYFNPNLVSPDVETGNEAINTSGFNHFLYEDRNPISPYFEFIHPLIMNIQDHLKLRHEVIERCRLNLTLPKNTVTAKHHLPHVDSFYPHWNALYYVNDSDGDTFIFDQTNKSFDANDEERIVKGDFTVKRQITPEKGKVIIFPGHYYHASSQPRTSKYRIVCNMNFAEI
jgi:hypothetical protein